MARDVGVVGVGQTDYSGKRNDRSHEELVFEAVSRALDHAGITREAVDGVCFGTMDPFDGVNRADKWMAGGAGALGKQYLKISTGGTTGLSAGIGTYQTLATDAHGTDVAIAVCMQRNGEADETQPVLNTVYDPFYDRALGLGAITQAAFVATRYEEKHGVTDEERAAVAVKNRQNGRDNPLSHLNTDIDIDDVLSSPVVSTPFRLHDIAPQSDGCVAVVMAADERATEIRDDPAWIVGHQEMADTMYLGDRPDLGRMGLLAQTAREMYQSMGIDDPYEFFDIAELYSPFSTREMTHIEALGLADPGEAKRWAIDGISHRDGAFPVDPSGGLLSTHPIAASGLIRLGEAALQVMGEAGNHQVDGVENAIVHAAGGNVQLHALMALSGNRRLT